MDRDIVTQTNRERERETQTERQIDWTVYRQSPLFFKFGNFYSSQMHYGTKYAFQQNMKYMGHCLYINKVRQKDRQTQGLMERQTDEQIERWTDGRMDKQRKKQIDKERN